MIYILLVEYHLVTSAFIFHGVYRCGIRRIATKTVMLVTVIG